MENVYNGKKLSMIDFIDFVVIIKNQNIIIISIDKLCPVYLTIEDIYKIQKFQRNEYSICPTLKIGKHLEVELHFDWTVIKDRNNQVAIKPEYIEEIIKYLIKLDKQKESK